MGSGFRKMVINTLERAVSTDINRLQSFIERDMAEAERYLMDVAQGPTDDFDAGAINAEFNVTGTPLRGEIKSGLLVKPQIGSFDLLVDPGVAYVVDVDAPPGPDDSVYKYVHDAGVTVLGTLDMTSNPGPGIRIDVIEVQRADVIVETDNRDIFNPISGLFTATAVTKGTAAKFNYRVRPGVPGGGIPAMAAGWMPLAIASNPSGSANNDVITFWDVRPLINDREFAPANMRSGLPHLDRFTGKIVTVAATAHLSGNVVAFQNGRRIGGNLLRGTPGTDLAFVALDDAANQSVVPPASGNYYVYLLTPFGLPRWARYTDAPGARVPRSPRGIVIGSTVAPQHIYGIPSAAIPLPASTGLGGTDATALCILALTTDPGSIIQPGVADKTVWSASSSFTQVPVPATALGAFATTFTLTDGTTHPPNAKAIWVQFNFTVTVPATTDLKVSGNYAVQDSGGHSIGFGDFGSRFLSNQTGAPTTPTITTQMLRIPIVSDYPATVGGPKIISFAPLTVPTAASMSVFGWEF